MTKADLTREEQLRRKRHHWHRHLHAWERSGLSQTEYCRRNSLSIKCFAYWKRKAKQQTAQTQLVPVPHALRQEVPYCDPPQATLKVELNNRFKIEVPDNFSTVAFSRLIAALASY